MPIPDQLRISLSPAASANALARSAVRFCAHALGVRYTFVDEGSEADIHYGEADGAKGSLWLPYWPESYEPSQPHVAVGDEHRRWWVPQARMSQRPVDLIGGVARLLALLDESQVAEEARGDSGVFRLSDLPRPRQEVQAEPLVEWHLAALIEHLELSGVRLTDRLARWPRGARYAVVLTHDVDGAALHDARELLRTAVRGIRYRSPPILAGAAAGLTGWITRKPDPHFRFSAWADLERSLGVTSAFFLHVRGGAPRHLNDPTYSVNDSSRWEVLRTLADDGWEFGVHAAIAAGRAASYLAGERQRLEQVVARRVLGVRHHYWRLDWRNPMKTFRLQEEAGYTYDLSIAWRDGYGFRAGTSLPYQPFDRLGGSVSVLEIPTTVMDTHLFEHLRLPGPEAAAALRKVASVVRRAGGVLNLNWHQETYWNLYGNAGWRTVYEEAVEELSDDPQAWITTPGELAAWWLDRARQLDEAAEGGVSVERS
jgi:hypothetical protein